ncbi:MAG: tripartite tricarboxylate transporter TctB family protein [Thermodesulfobacteriota bacterium]
MADRISALVIISFSLYFYYLAGQLPVIKGFQKMGDSFWPRLILVIVMVLSAILFLRSFLKREQVTPKVISPTSAKGSLAAVMIVSVFYIISISYLGFLFSTFLFLMIFSYIMGDRKLSGIFIFSLAMTAIIYLIFGLLIYSALPRGEWIFKTLSTYIY